MNGQTGGIIALVLVGLGVVLIGLGAWMSVKEWNKQQFGAPPEARADAIAPTIDALTKLVTALKDYPAGQRLIVLGILLVILGGIFGGVSGLAAPDAAPKA